MMYFYCFILLPLAVNFSCRVVHNKSVQETASCERGLVGDASANDVYTKFEEGILS